MGCSSAANHSKSKVSKSDFLSVFFTLLRFLFSFYLSFALFFALKRTVKAYNCNGLRTPNKPLFLVANQHRVYLILVHNALNFGDFSVRKNGLRRSCHNVFYRVVEEF